MMIKDILPILLVVLFFFNCKKKEYVDKIYEKPEIVMEAPSNFLSPEESMKTFYLPEGYKVELVASEPMVDEPVTIAWDGDGRMYVAEMNTYMQDVDGSGTNRSISKIKLLEDTDGDGRMDKSTVFIDSLLLPRMILPLENELIVNETFSYDLWSYKDTDGDGVADKKERVYYNPNRRGGNLEHQQSGLLWNLDNWVYTTYNPIRFKFQKNKVIVDSLENMPSGQWGLTQDDMGVMYYSSAGSENPAYGFQQPAAYGNYNPEGRLSEGFMEPWPVVGTPDVQGGPDRLRPDNTLNHFTGVAGQEIFQGHRLPPSTYGDLFIPEPVGRLIRRAKVKIEDGKKVLYNAYDQAEFMASTDLNFRPIQAKTGPDGALYIVDMYRGIIQESNWTKKGSSLRPVIIRKELDKNIGKGRIYRIVHEDIKPDSKKPNLLGKKASDLIEYLGHKNGWYRNTAQKLIILKDDKSVISELKEIASDNNSWWIKLFGTDMDLGIQRVHALWTLEGLGVVDKALIKEKFLDEDERVRVTAIRLSEKFLKAGDTDLFSSLEKLASDGSLEVANQLALSLRYSKDKKATDILNKIGAKYESNEIVSHSVKESLKKDDSRLAQLKTRLAAKGLGDKQSIFRGYDSYNQLCITCHGIDLKGVPTEDGTLIAPTLIGSPRVTGDEKGKLSKILLNGLIGPIDGTDYGIMMPLKANDDQWIADVLTYVRAMNDIDGVHKNVVKKAREQSKDREDYWTLKELEKEK
ncbi:putative membrane-bound dehydrogenase-like protein [Mariniflexile fucanivorans]|uniref:Putative membrane-bound dehydrogenase-like protein n=1 Tax=Mariniflexile fucanivorans TaxID=264023 RepID=A0A4V2QDT4_9FLAO|nr:c-type cytochrome [Mariniflexile fucanivorans]TCL65507.1 putative membrane-bound dehydrogenase-like protein [Mariniflexile fucanivorans]